MNIVIASDNLCNFTGHQDTLTGDYINSATVTASVLDGTTTVFSQSLTYVPSSNGNYRGTFTAAQTANLTTGQTYVLQIVSVSTYGTLTTKDEIQATYAS